MVVTLDLVENKTQRIFQQYQMPTIEGQNDIIPGNYGALAVEKVPRKVQRLVYLRLWS